MNTADLVNSIVKETGITKALARKILRAHHATIVKAVSKGNRVAIAGFGTYQQVMSKPRVARNIQTGKQIKIPATKRAKFRPGTDFKKRVKSGR